MMNNYIILIAYFYVYSKQELFIILHAEKNKSNCDY